MENAHFTLLKIDSTGSHRQRKAAKPNICFKIYLNHQTKIRLIYCDRIVIWQNHGFTIPSLNCSAETSSISWKMGNTVKIPNAVKDTFIVTKGCYTLKSTFLLLLWVMSHPLSDIFYGRFIDIMWNILFCFWPTFPFLFFFLLLLLLLLHSVFSDGAAVAWKFQKVNSCTYKSLVAQRGHCSVSCPRQWIEQFSFTHVPDCLL